MLNGDTFFEVDLKQLAHFHIERASEWTFVLFRASEIGRYMGLEVADDGRIHRLRSDTAQPGRLANGGAYLVEPSVLHGFPKKADKKYSLENDLLPFLLNRGRGLYGMEQSGRFIDIGIPEDYLLAVEMLTR